MCYQKDIPFQTETRKKGQLRPHQKTQAQSEALALLALGNHRLPSICHLGSAATNATASQSQDAAAPPKVYQNRATRVPLRPLLRLP